MFGIQHHRNNMDVKVRVLYAWPNDQLSPDLADLWPNVGMAMAILDFMSIGIDTKRDWQMKSFSWCLPLNAKEGYRCVILILTSRVLTHTWRSFSQNFSSQLLKLSFTQCCHS